MGNRSGYESVPGENGPPYSPLAATINSGGPPSLLGDMGMGDFVSKGKMKDIRRSAEAEEEELPFQAIPEDALYIVISFLDLNAIQNLCLVHSYLRKRIHTASIVWRQLSERSLHVILPTPVLPKTGYGTFPVDELDVNLMSQARKQFKVEWRINYDKRPDVVQRRRWKKDVDGLKRTVTNFNIGTMCVHGPWWEAFLILNLFSTILFAPFVAMGVLNKWFALLPLMLIFCHGFFGTLSSVIIPLFFCVDLVSRAKVGVVFFLTNFANFYSIPREFRLMLMAQSLTVHAAMLSIILTMINVLHVPAIIIALLFSPSVFMWIFVIFMTLETNTKYWLDLFSHGFIALNVFTFIVLCCLKVEGFGIFMGPMDVKWVYVFIPLYVAQFCLLLLLPFSVEMGKRFFFSTVYDDYDFWFWVIFAIMNTVSGYMMLMSSLKFIGGFGIPLPVIFIPVMLGALITAVSWVYIYIDETDPFSSTGHSKLWVNFVEVRAAYARGGLRMRWNSSDWQ